MYPLRPTALLFACLLFGMSAADAVAEDRSETLFADDFSRYPEGVLSRPFGNVNPAVQEYHYFAHRGTPLAPWSNAICYLDAWAGDRETGRPALRQVLSRRDSRMEVNMFAPLFITGDPEWTEYTVQAEVTPLSDDGVSGIVLNYLTNRNHIVFQLQKGKEARLALRLPLEKKLRVIEWKELGTVPFPYETGRKYTLKVASQNGHLVASIDGTEVISATCAEQLQGKAGLVADVPTRFENFTVTVSPETRQVIDSRIARHEREIEQLRAQNPQPVLWRSFETPGFGAGRNVRFGDLNGDGEIDMLIGQNIQLTDSNAATELSCVTAVTLRGEVLWQWGEPRDDLTNALITCDCPFQIHDLDGHGKNDVVLAVERKLKILDGATGQEKLSVDVPLVTSYPEVPQRASRNTPTNVSSGDCLAFADFTGSGRRDHVILKDRYWNFWVFDNSLQQKWTGQGMLGHYPFPFHDPQSKQDQLAIGYALWTSDGKMLWSLDNELKDHADGIAVGNFTGNPAEPPRCYYAGSDEGIIVVDMRGFIQKHVRLGHAQTVTVGHFRNDLPGLQLATVNFWKNPGVISLLDADGNLLQQAEPMHSGSPLMPVNWRGNGEEFIFLSGNPQEGGLLDGRLRRVVMFPDDGHPEMCGDALDLTGDSRDEIVLWDNRRVAIYTQDRPTTGAWVYAPVRNPECNNSNYRSVVSLPGWEEIPASSP